VSLRCEGGGGGAAVVAVVVVSLPMLLVIVPVRWQRRHREKRTPSCCRLKWCRLTIEERRDGVWLVLPQVGMPGSGVGWVGVGWVGLGTDLYLVLGAGISGRVR